MAPRPGPATNGGSPRRRRGAEGPPPTREPGPTRTWSRRAPGQVGALRTYSPMSADLASGQHETTSTIQRITITNDYTIWSWMTNSRAKENNNIFRRTMEWTIIAKRELDSRMFIVSLILRHRLMDTRAVFITISPGIHESNLR